MSDDSFNLSMRKFLKTVGVTSQTKIEEAVRDAKAAGKIGKGPLNAKVHLTVDGIDLSHVIEGKISLSEDG